MRKADLTKRIMASAFVVAGLTMLGQDAKAQIVMPQSDNNDSGNLILDKKSKKISKSLKNIKLMGNSKYSEPADSHPELVNSHPEPADSHPGLVNSHPELVNSHPELVSGSNNNVTLNSFQGLSDGKNSKILNRVQNDRIFANGITTGGAAPTPTLDDLQSNASTVMPTLSGKYDLATEEGENTRSIVINGTTYYYTPNEDSQDKLNMLDYLAGSSSVPDALIVDTSATTEHYLFKAGETYYTFDTTKLPVSSYTGTTYSDFAFKNNPSDVATFENGASGNYDVKVSFDNNSDHTKYYNININPTKASHVGSKLSNINWSTTDPYSDPDKWEDYYSAGSKVTVGESTITGAIRMKMSHNGSVPEPSSWNKYFTYTYTKPTGYTITRARLNDNVTTDAVNKKVFAGITDEYPYNGAAIYNTNDLSAINITADFIGNYTSPNGAGGAIYNKSNAKIGSIVGNFIGNHSYFYGGAIANDGTIGSIIGDFVGNSTVFDYDGTARGGAIGNAYSATISSITGDFIGNFAYSATSSYGGAISNEGTISSITGDFIGNSAFSSSSTSYGGAISNEGTISSITGDFIGNSASSSSSYSYGGAIYNSSGKISSITGDFVGNYASASSESYGGAISNEGTISSITGDFIGNSASSSGSSDAYGGAIYNDNAISSITGDFIGNSASTSGPGSYANGGAIYNDGTITLAGNTFTGNYTQVGEGTDAVITPNSIYNAGIINIADGATVTINDGYDGLGEAQLNIGTSASSGSVFNLSVDNGTIQTDNLGTVANNGTINWDLDVDLTNTNSDKIAASFADVEGNNKSIIINAINLVTGTGSDKIEITLTDNAALKTAYTLSSDIMNHITKASSAVTYTVNNVTYDSATGKLIFNAPVILDSLALKVHTGDPKVREYNMTALETVGENLGSLAGDSGAKLTVNGDKFDINGNGYTGITVNSGQTLEFNNVGDTTSDTSKGAYGFKPADGAVVYNKAGGTFTATNSVFSDNTTSDSGSGAVLANYGNATITNSMFKDNSATNIGGAIYNEGTISSITGSTFSNNTANYGGAIYNQGANVINISNSTFSNNIANALGGAIINQGTVNITDTNFSGNKGNGAAIFNEGGGSVYITADSANVSFTDNYFGENKNDINSIGSLYLRAKDGKNISFDGSIDGGGTTVIGGTYETTQKYTGTVNFNDTVTQKDLTIEDGANVQIAANNLNITNAVKNAGNITLTGNDVVLRSNITNKSEDDAGQTIIDGSVSLYSGTAGVYSGNVISQNILINAGTGHKLSANVAGIKGDVTNNADLVIFSQDPITSESTHFTQAVDGSGVTTIQRNVNVDSTIANNVVIDKYIDTSSNTHYANVVVGSTGSLGTTGKTIEIKAGDGTNYNTLTIGTGSVAADSITNNSKLVLNNSTSGTLSKAISGSGTLDIATTGENADSTVITTGNTITNQNINVQKGVFKVANASHLAGTTNVNVGDGAVIDTIDNVINDYSSTVLLADGAIVNADINATSIDKYGAASGATVTLGAINALSTGDFQTREFQLVSNGATVNADGLAIINTTGKSVSIVGSGTNDGKVLVSESESTNKLNGAVYISPTKTSITYIMGTDEVVNNDRPALGYIKDEFEIKSNNTTQKVITANQVGTYSNTKGLIVDTGKKLTVDNIKFQNFATGEINSTTYPTADRAYDGNYEGIITVKSGATLNVKDSYFQVVDGDGNTKKIAIANYGTVTSDPSIYEGGVMNYKGATFTVAGDTFQNITRTGENGGAIYNEAAAGSTPAGTLYVQKDTSDNKTTFVNNTANNGGAIYNAGTATISDAIFGDLTDSTKGNSATNSGGAIYNYAGNMTISGSTFGNNTAASGGGVIYNRANASISNSTLSSNSAVYGGAIYNTAGTMTVSGSTFSNNRATNTGGAIHNRVAMTITDSSFINNTTDTGNGGAIWTSADLTINATSSAVEFTGNKTRTATTAVNNDIYMSGGTGTPIALNLNAANKTDKTITLGSGVNGTNYNVNVNNGTTGKVTIASLAGAGTIALKGGELDLTSDTTATALTASDATTLNASSTNGLSVGTLTVEDGKTFTNSGNLTVTSTLTNGHDGTGNTGTITNDGTLNLKGNTPPHNFENKGTINGNGTLVIGDGTTNKTLLSSTGNISNKITIMANSELDADPDQLTVTDGTLKNDGTLRLTGGTIKFNVANNTGTAGHTDITANSVDFDSTAHAINQQINIILDDSSTTGNSVLVADGANIGGNVAIDGGTETRDSILRLTGGTMNHNITGYTNPSTTLTTYGNVEITGNVAFASGKTAQVSELSVGLGKTLTNNGTFTVSEELTNSGTISNSGTGILNLLGGESATDTMANAGTINGTGKVNIGSYTSDTEKDVAYVVNTGSGSITGDITIAKESTLKTASDKVTDSNGLTNDGTLVFNNSADGDINQDISGSGTSSTGVVEIAAGNDVTVDMNGKTITNNTIKLTSGTLYTGDSTTGNVDLSGTTIEANGGTLSVQDGKTGTIKLGTVDTATNGKDLNVAIDADFMHNYTTNDRGIVGSADVISATSVTGTNKIHVSDIKLSWDTSADPAETNQHPIGTEFTAQIADSATKGAIDLTNTTTSITPGYRTGAGNILLTYNSSTGYLTGIHSTLNDAITSSVDTKMYYMDVMDGDTPLYTTVIDGPKTLNGNSLSITTSGNNITSVTAGNDGIVIGNASRILSIIGTNPDTTQPNTTISGFGTAIDNTSGGKVNLTDVTMTGNTKDIINNGHAADKGVYLAGTNNITSIVDSDGTHTHGQTTVKSGTSTIGTIQQKSVTVDAGATANLTNIANVATTDGITNNGDLVLAGGDATTVATNANKITMTAAAGNAKTTIAAGSNITNTAVMTQKEVEVSAATTTPAADAAKLANNSTINADTINVKADATLENNDGAKIFASNGADKASIVAEAGANIDLNKGSEATADVTLASSTSDLTITDNGKLSGGVKTSNGGSINLVADTQDISMNSAITGAITGADGTGNGSYKVTATSTPQTTPNTVTIDKAIAGATEVDVNADTVAVITDTAYTFTSAPVKVGNNGDLTLENTTSGETTVGSAISALTATDKFDVTVDNSANGGKTNINNTISGAETVTGNGGTTNLNSTITGADAVIAQAGTTNINTGAGSNTSAQIGTAKIDIKDGATAGVNTTSNNFVLDNNVEGETADSTLKLSGNSGTPGTASDPGTQFNIASDVNGGTVEIAQGQLNLPSEDKVANANGVKVDRGATLNTMNGATNNYNSNIKFEDASQVKVDVNAINKASDRFQNPQQASGAGVVLTDVAIQDLDKIVHRNTDIDLRGTTNLANITVGSELLNKKFQAMTPIRIMEATIDQNGMMNIHPSSGRNDYNSFNPAAVVGPIAAQMGGYLSQLNSYDEAFRNLDMKMLMTREERQAYKMANRYASGEAPSVFSETYLPEKSSAGWFRPYASFERVGLKHGPGVSNVMYGSYFGGDSAMKELRNGWDYQWSVYVGYNGSHQAYAGQSIYQNGGNLGATGVWYKDNFFTALTANVGASVANASTTFGSEDFPMLMSGVASKTGYNWELAKGKFIIQPSYLMSYTFVNTFDYTNAAGVRINSDPLHAINITPGLKFIGNLKNGWQPYAGVQMVWSIMDQTNFHANDIPLPQMSVKPYFQYGIGVQKRWGERFTGFFQAMLRNGGRNGVALSAGFRWALGKAPSAKSAVTPKTSKSKQTVVKQQDKKVIKSSSTKTSKLSSFLADMDGEQTYVVKVEK